MAQVRKEKIMLPFFLVLAVVAFLFFIGFSVSMYLYRSGALRYHSGRHSTHSSAIDTLPATLEDAESQEAIEEAEYYINLVSSWKR